MQKRLNKWVGTMLVGLLIVPMGAFAEEEGAKPKISWSAWGRAIIAPIVSNDKGDQVPRDAASWGGDERIGFTIKGESENVGFHVDMKADGGEINTCQDQQKIWVKPTKSLTVEAGPNVFYDVLRGNADFGSWNWLRFNGIEGEDNIFARGQAGGGDGTRTPNATAGSIVHVDTNGWHVFGAVNIIEEGDEIQIGDDFRDADGDGEADREQYTSSLMLARGQYGIGYEIPGVGMVRAQYIGKSYVKDLTSDELESYGIVNAAVKLDQIVDDLYLDLGVFMPTDEDNTNGDNTTLAMYAKYNLGSLTPHLLIEAELDKADAEGDEGTGIKGGFGVDVSLGNDLVINTDLRYHNETAVAVSDVDNQVAFLVGLQKHFSNGIIGVGFQGTTHDFGSIVSKEDKDDFVWAIPVKLEYWF